jgi:hypothetical protein
MPDLNANDIDAAMKIIAGTARQMGVTPSDRPELTHPPVRGAGHPHMPCGAR